MKKIRIKPVAAPFALCAGHKWLLLSSLFSFILLCMRMVATGTPEYAFLLWNLFLAFLPWGITLLFAQNRTWLERRAWRFLAGSAWLLLLPNSFYIVTDLLHFTYVRTAPKWFDLLMIVSFAWNGLLFGFFSLRRMDQLVSLFSGKRSGLALLFGFMWLIFLGVYIGRYLRYNSWDVVASPFALAADIFAMVKHPVAHAKVWAMTVLYAVFSTLLYLTFSELSALFLKEKKVA